MMMSPGVSWRLVPRSLALTGPNCPATLIDRTGNSLGPVQMQDKTIGAQVVAKEWDLVSPRPNRNQSNSDCHTLILNPSLD
jgi:hypothetical protein